MNHETNAQINPDNTATTHIIEEGKTDEAKFAKSMDRFEPLLQNASNSGGTWVEYDVPYQKVFDKKEEIKREIREDCNITLAHFQVVMGKLKKSGVFVDGNINPKFIPNLKMDKGNLQMLLYFTF